MNNNGIISAPIGLQPDVYGVLGLVKTGTYYDVGYVCSNEHGRTNKWARYKPVRFNSPAGYAANANWWKGDDGLCERCRQRKREYKRPYSIFPEIVTSSHTNGGVYYSFLICAIWKTAPPSGIEPLSFPPEGNALSIMLWRRTSGF